MHIDFHNMKRRKKKKKKNVRNKTAKNYFEKHANQTKRKETLKKKKTTNKQIQKKKNVKLWRRSSSSTFIQGFVERERYRSAGSLIGATTRKAISPIALTSRVFSSTTFCDFLFSVSSYYFSFLLYIYIYIYTFQFLSRWSLSNQLGPIIVLGVNLRVFCTVLLSAENYSIMCRVSVLLS